MLGLFSDPEDGGDMFLQIVGWLSTDYITYITEDVELFEYFKLYIKDSDNDSQ
jgi:hypothetical protein